MPPRGWIWLKSGERHEVPEHLLDKETIFWPFGLAEVRPGRPTPMMSEPYRRHALVPGEAYIYTAEGVNPRTIPEATIQELLGPLASRRPTRVEVAPRSLSLISDGIAQRTMETWPQCVLVIPAGMWADASDPSRQVFQNICRIHGVSYRMENTGISGAYWDCSGVSR